MENKTPQITWDIGTAYDLFVSLYVLYHPGKFGVRRKWAAGVRSRLPQNAHHFFKTYQDILPVPLRWLSQLPDSRE